MLISCEMTWKVMHLDCVNSLQGDEWRVFSIPTARASLMRERCAETVDAVGQNQHDEMGQNAYDG